MRTLTVTSMLLLSVVIARPAYGKCVDVPSVEVKIEVTACHATSFGAGLEKHHFDGIMTSNANVSRVTLTGEVLASGLRWRYPPPHRRMGNDKWEPKPFPKGAHDRFLVIGSEFKDCPTFLKSPVHLLSSSQCCDTLPRSETCAVPQKIYQLVTTSVESWPIQVGK
jgi:hypothetical protein